MSIDESSMITPITMQPEMLIANVLQGKTEKLRRSIKRSRP